MIVYPYDIPEVAETILAGHAPGEMSASTSFLFLTNSSGAIAIFVWLVIAVSQLRLRRRIEREAPHLLTLRMWAYPYLTWASIAGSDAGQRFAALRNATSRGIRKRRRTSCQKGSPGWAGVCGSGARGRGV